MAVQKHLAGALGALAVCCMVAVLVYERAAPSELLLVEPAPGQVLYGGHHWGGVGSEGYGTSSWDNTGWNAHYHPRDGASMDSESMEPYTWRKGPRVNDEYTGVMASGDPTVDPPDSWEPPINFHKAPVQSLRQAQKGKKVAKSISFAKWPAWRGQKQLLYGGSHWGGVGSEGYGTSSWDNRWHAYPSCS
mmetsp:Transcript_21634/g.33852  ORF Transcript_21634/g.33852 Transcript_21634/m.33852 type:complete len:190 (+) Transcript_21634:52-621(+)